MTSRGRLILLVVLFVALLLALGNLKRRALIDEETGYETQVSAGQGDSPATRVSAWRRLLPGSRFASASDTRTTSRPVRITRIAESERSEGFEAEKYRAFGDASVFGHVRGEKAAPVEGAQVELYENDPMTKNPPLRTATTDAQGSYTLSQLNSRERNYVLVVRAQGYVPEARRIALSGRPLAQNIHLERGVELSGVVRDAETSQTLSGATIYYPSSSAIIFGVLGSVTSGAGGQFCFPAVRPKGNRVLAEREGYHHALTTLRAPAKDAEIAMRPGGATLRGVAVERRGQKPVAGAKIVLQAESFQESVLSKEDGAFEFLDLPAGEYRLFGVRGMPSPKQAVKLGEREVREEVKVVLPSDLFVTGRVVNVQNGHPLPGVRVYYRAPSGKSSVVSDEQGQFGFETFVLSEYTLEVHEKGFLPVTGKKTTGSVERITRKVAASAASDQVTIRLRPVPCISGIVRRQAKTGNRRAPAWGVDVQVAYVQGKIFEEKIAQTDAAGKFFVNLAGKGRGTAKVIARRGQLIDVASAKIPSRKPMELLIKPSTMQGILALSDASELSGIRVKQNYLFPDTLPPERALRLKGGEMFTNARGRFFLPMAKRQKVELVFHLPDGKQLAKLFDSNLLLRKRQTFVYDPVSGEILSNVERANRKSQMGLSGTRKQNQKMKPKKQNPNKNRPGKKTTPKPAATPSST